MKRLAFFVEGLTEQLFIKKLLIELAGSKKIDIEEIKYSFKDKSLLNIKARSKTNKNYHVLIINCAGDTRVPSAVSEEHSNLVKKGYDKILGLRDIYPKKYADLPQLERAAKYGIPTRPIPTDVLLAVAEVEAWFIAEHSHFERIDKILTFDFIKDKFSHNPALNHVEQIEHPAKELDIVYRHAGKRYEKQRNDLSRTIKALDFNNLYLNLPNRVVYLKKLITHIDSFLV